MKQKKTPSSLVRMDTAELAILRQLKRETGVPMRELARRGVRLLRDTRKFLALLESDFQIDMAEDADSKAWLKGVGALKDAYRKAIQPGA